MDIPQRELIPTEHCPGKVLPVDEWTPLDSLCNMTDCHHKLPARRELHPTLYRVPQTRHSGDITGTATVLLVETVLLTTYIIQVTRSAIQGRNSPVKYLLSIFNMIDPWHGIFSFQTIIAQKCFFAYEQC